MDIKLYDANLEIYGKPIDTFSSLTYTDRWSADGEFKLVLPVEKYNDVKDAAYLYVDGRMFEIATINTCDQSANNQLTLSGHNLNVLLSRVVISTPERIQGKLETEIRTLVSSLCISGWQAIPKFALGTLQGYARAMDANTKRGSLSDFLYTELNKRGFSFSLTYDDVNDEIVFDIVQSLDRTQDQTDNTFATFSASLGNIQNMEYERNESEYYNCAVVCDEAETSPQTVVVDLSNGEPKRTIYVSGTSAGADTSAAPNLYVMVGTYSAGVGYIATSTDGQTWTTRVSSVILPCWSVDYQNGRFIVGGGGYVHTSTDGISWDTVLIQAGISIEGVNYVDGIYLAYEVTGVIHFSYDLSTWNTVSSASNKIVNSVYCADRFVSYLAGFGIGYKVTSSDGVTWNETIVPLGIVGTSTQIGRTMFYGGLIVSAGFWYASPTYTPMTIVSDDCGETETVYSISSLSGKRFLDAAYGQGVFVAVGQPNLIAWSTDGKTWTDCTPAGGTPDYIAVTFDGSQFHAYSATTKHHAYSADGKTWTLTTFTTSAGLIDAVVYGTSSHSMSLYDIGYNALQTYKPVEVIDGEVLPDAHPLLGSEYNVGDVVDIVDQARGIIVSKVLSEAQTIYERDKSIIVPKFGENYLSLKKFIKKEIDRLV